MNNDEWKRIQQMYGATWSPPPVRDHSPEAAEAAQAVSEAISEQLAAEAQRRAHLSETMAAVRRVVGMGLGAAPGLPAVTPDDPEWWATCKDPESAIRAWVDSWKSPCHDPIADLRRRITAPAPGPTFLSVAQAEQALTLAEENRSFDHDELRTFAEHLATVHGSAVAQRWLQRTANALTERRHMNRRQRRAARARARRRR